MKINDLIKNRRLECGLTLKEIADKVGVSEGTVSRWESGEIANMRRDKILLLAQALDISPAIIMGWDITNDPRSGVQPPSDDFVFSPFERTLITTYRASDQLTKDMVNRILNLDEPAQQDKMA